MGVRAPLTIAISKDEFDIGIYRMSPGFVGKHSSLSAPQEQRQTGESELTTDLHGYTRITESA
jgi:hypothetical protein